MINKENRLAGKSILFIGQSFYDYHLKIINELEKSGAEVSFFENKFFPEDSGTSRPGIVRSVRRLFLGNRKGKYTQQIIAEVGNKKYDFVFCIGGFSITPELLGFLKLNNKDLISIIYFWDSFSVWNYSDLLPLFDYTYSFDPLDCEHWEGLRYAPLFYTDEYNKVPNVTEDIDFLYVGSVGIPSENRCDFLLEADRFSKRMGYHSFLWLYYSADNKTLMKKAKNEFKRLFLPSYRKFIIKINECRKNAGFIRDKVISREEVANLMNRTKCIIDIPVPGQAGLTMRTIETLAMGKKIITTNMHVKKEKFYDPMYIKVVEHFEEVDHDFVTAAPSHKIEISSQRLSEWINSFFKQV
ncbi:hypothetical protein MRBLMN1_001480 [Chitinophaga ginsengisegetis]|uniref:hypothetical protein n=1 Tax=Chitinophaga ginsengisegetis TaxID=393003 RepID=UPI00343DE558